MFESSCRVVLSLPHDITRTPNQENHFSVYDWNIELLIFNAVKLQTIMESIQWMVPQDSPIVALAQQGAEAVD
jgi:hypothetical protein